MEKNIFVFCFLLLFLLGKYFLPEGYYFNEKEANNNKEFEFYHDQPYLIAKFESERFANPQGDHKPPNNIT